METYLRGVNSTFIHYTSHAVDHSDQIVRELSNMLYVDGSDQSSITVNLNATETYLLLLASYLHDAGMVVTDNEKLQVLSSSEWREFAANNEHIAADVKRLQETLQGTYGTSTEAQSLFVAALEQRLLLADYFRRRHADRARGAINGALRIAEDFLGGDPSAAATLSAICVGHGLNRSELATDMSYPTRRDLFGEAVNVRLLAVLLRLGDLLDMRFDRACPLLQSIASPLPQSSDVHWSQYQRIKSRVTSPSRIEIRAECESAQEHRLIRDWCTWLADEVRDAPRLLAGSTRHANWLPPKATVGDSHDTIQVVRAPGARYRAEDWRFYFDEAEIIVRLVRDVHRVKFGFIRELLQNSLDTSRAQAYKVSGSTERYPNHLPQEIRDQYPVVITLTVGERGVEQVEVSDHGLGMTPDIILNYFLQIGRSWYRSSEFSQDFSFSPTSRFGIGFLSVFAVSEDVSVTTRWHEDDSTRALRMQLSSPRSYILLEDASRQSPGTTVRVRLNEPADKERLVRYLEHLCVANEFPVFIEIEQDGERSSFEKLPKNNVSMGQMLLAPDISISSKRVSCTAEGVFGYLEFITLHHASEPDDWVVSGSDLRYLVRGENILAEIPSFPSPCVAINGLRSDSSDYGFIGRDRDMWWNLDLRIPEAATHAGLDRNAAENSSRFMALDLGHVLEDHLHSREASREYISGLVERFGTIASQWARSICYLPTVNGPDVSIEMASSAQPRLLVSFLPSRHQPDFDLTSREEEILRDFKAQHPGIHLLAPSTNRLLEEYAKYRLRDAIASMSRLYRLDDEIYVLELLMRQLGDASSLEQSVTFPADSTIVAITPPLDLPIILNQSHPFVKAVLSIPSNHAAVRAQLIEEIRITAKFRGEYSPLIELTRAVANALQEDTLLRYAEHMTTIAETQPFSGLLTLPIAISSEPAEPL